MSDDPFAVADPEEDPEGDDEPEDAAESEDLEPLELPLEDETGEPELLELEFELALCDFEDFLESVA